MGRDNGIGPGLGMTLLAAIVIAAVYWTSHFVGDQETYFHKFVGTMDVAIENAYGKTITDRQVTR